MFIKQVLKTTGFVILLVSVAVRADLITESITVDTAIPDNDASGLASSITISSELDTISSLTVSLKISGVSSSSLAFGGDLYCSLQNEDGGFTVLLNRVGKTSSDDWGYDMNGFDVTFSIDGSDIHAAEDHSPSYDSAGRLTGSWDVDGRTVDPADVVDTNTRSALLSSFTDTNPNGTWTLFVADTSENGTAKLDSWGVNIQAVPEPAMMTLIGLAGGLTLFIRRFLA